MQNIAKLTTLFLFYLSIMLLPSVCSANGQEIDREKREDIENSLKSISSQISKIKNLEKTSSSSLKDKFNSQQNTQDTLILNARRGISIMAGKPSPNLGRTIKGFRDNDKVVTITFKFETSHEDKNFKENLYKSTIFRKVLNNDTTSHYYTRWKNPFSFIIEGVMSKRYFSTLKYYKIPDKQHRIAREIVSSDIRGWGCNSSYEFDAGPWHIAKFGQGYETKSLFNNSFMEFDKRLSIDKIFDPGRSHSDNDNLADMSLSKNKFYYTMPNGEVRFGYYDISPPHYGKSNDVIRKWIDNRLQFKCLRDSVS